MRCRTSSEAAPCSFPLTKQRVHSLVERFAAHVAVSDDTIPVKDVAKATGLYNLTRQLGGSIGIAVLTTLLASRTAFHRAVLVEKLGQTDVATVERVRQLTAGFVAKGFDPASAKQQALVVLDGSVNMQAQVMSFADSFWLVAIVFLCTMPLILLLGKVKPGGGMKQAAAANPTDAH